MRLLGLIALLCAPSLAMAGDCLDYDVPVALTGTYSTGMFPGPPYDDDAELIEHRFINLASPICTKATEDSFYDPADNVTQVELLPTCPGTTPGEAITASGELFGAHTGHHIAPVLIDCPAQ